MIVAMFGVTPILLNPLAIKLTKGRKIYLKRNFDAVIIFDFSKVEIFDNINLEVF
jgi:hypothetical protein